MAGVPFVLHAIAQGRAEWEEAEEARRRAEGRADGGLVRRLASASIPETPFPVRRQRCLNQLAQEWELQLRRPKNPGEQMQLHCGFLTRALMSAFQRQNRESFIRVLEDDSTNARLIKVAALRFCRAHLFRMYVKLALPFRPHDTADGAAFGLPPDMVQCVVSYFPLRTLKAVSLVSRALLHTCHPILASRAASASQLLQWAQPQMLVAAADPDCLAAAALVDGARPLATAGARDAMAVACALVLVQHCPPPELGLHLTALLRLAGSETQPLATLLTEVITSPTLETFEAHLPQYFEATASSGRLEGREDPPASQGGETTPSF